MTDKKTLEPAHDLPEAPASATVKIKDNEGFYWMFTIRDEKAFVLLDKMKLLTAEWKANNWTPVEERGYGGNTQFRQAPKVQKPCPVHQGELLTEKISKKTGKAYFSHSRGAYPNLDMCFGEGYASERQRSNDIPERDISDY